MYNLQPERLQHYIVGIPIISRSFWLQVNVREISRQSFQKSRNCWISEQLANHATKTKEIRKFTKFRNASQGCPLLLKFQNAVALFTGDFWKFRSKFFIAWKASLVWKFPVSNEMIFLLKFFALSRIQHIFGTFYRKSFPYHVCPFRKI